MKAKSKVRSGAYAVCFSLGFIALTAGKGHSQSRAFSFAERVAYQRIIEDVYWRHRIWPKENPNPKPSLDAVMSQGQLENKVEDYLHHSLTLQNYGRPITAEQLQAELNRMARDTKQPEVLRELFEALGNDPAVTAECLARPILAERLIADFSAQDQTRHVESPQTEALRAMSAATTLGQVAYTLPEIANACADQWGATSMLHVPSARTGHRAVWTGSEMIVWGGWGGGPELNTGGRYNPSTDSWSATSTVNAPAGRENHTAVWTGTQMIVWGGYNNGYLNSGGKYNPSTDSWIATNTTNAPEGRDLHTAIWTGSTMVVWGGGNNTANLNTGGRYNPTSDSWTATGTTNAPAARAQHTAVWTGSEMIVWGGHPYVNTGGRYNPSTNTWTATTTNNAPSARGLHTAVWTGSEMIIWGGYNDPNFAFNTGGRYNPSTDSWIPTSTNNAPVARYWHTAVWTGSEMIAWGGVDETSSYSNTGGRYDPITNSWTATSTNNAPLARYQHAAVWTGSEMIVWAGGNCCGPLQWLNTGGRYCGGPYPTPAPTATPTPTPTVPPPLTIIQPNGGEAWFMGSVEQITWSGTNLTQSDRLIIQYSRDGGATWGRIAQNVPALSLSYSWHVHNYPTTQGRMKILLQGNLSVTDQSDANFTVQPRPYVTLLRPNGGEVWTVGQYYNIHWSRQNPNGNTVDVDYSTDNGATWTRIATQAQDTGWYLWNVPSPATTMAKVRISFHETPSVTDTSDAVFMVISP